MNVNDLSIYERMGESLLSMIINDLYDQVDYHPLLK